MTFIKREQVTEYDAHNFEADASELRWSPGCFPTIVDTDLGNGRPLMRNRITREGSHIYQQEFGCIVLVVWND